MVLKNTRFLKTRDSQKTRENQKHVIFKNTRFSKTRDFQKTRDSQKKRVILKNTRFRIKTPEIGNFFVSECLRFAYVVDQLVENLLKMVCARSVPSVITFALSRMRLYMIKR